MSLRSVKMATTTINVVESSLVSQYLDVCHALASMGPTISFSLTLGSIFYFNLGTNLFHLNPLSNDVPCNSQIMSIVKDTTHRSPDIPCREQSVNSMYVISWIKNPYTKTPYHFTAECVLKQGVKFSDQ